jgi:WD40 repeat protein
VRPTTRRPAPIFAPHTKGIEPYRKLVGPKDWIARVSWSPDSKSVCAASKGNLFVWDIETAETRLQIKLPAYHVFEGAWSPDGLLIACASDDGHVRVYDAVEGRMQSEFEPGQHDGRRQR